MPSRAKIRPPISQLCLVLWLCVAWPEGVKCASAMASHDTTSSWTAPTAFFHPRLHGRRAVLQASSTTRGVPAVRRAGVTFCSTSTAPIMRRPTHGGLASLCMQSNKLPGGVDGLFKTVQRTFNLVKVFVQQNMRSGLIFPTVMLVLWSTGQFQWLFSIFNFFFVLIVVVPTILVIGLNLWVKSSVVDGACPNCKARVMLPKNQQSACMSCGTPLLCVDGRIERSSIYNTQQDATGKKSAADVYDVEAIDIDAK